MSSFPCPENRNFVRVWDLPTRLFHVALLSCVGGLFITAHMGGLAMPVHFFLGYLVLSLILFRICWGFLGGHWSRFSQFVPSPRQLLQYVRKSSQNSEIGHNPLGAISVLIMLLVLLLQVLSGFCSDDEIAAAGPWTSWVHSDWIERCTHYHTDIGQFLLMGLIGMHIAAVLYYKWFQRKNLITPMLTGDKPLPATTIASQDNWKTRLFALLIWCAAFGLTWQLTTLRLV